jgi:hypothetical protein
MTIYLVKGWVDQAATSLADAQTLLTALADPLDPDNAYSIATVSSKLETLIQGDSGEPLVISSIDDTNGNISSWVTDTSTTLAVGLGFADPRSSFAFASTNALSISGNTRLGTLALNTATLSAVLAGQFSYRSAALPVTPDGSARMILQIVRTTSGATETVGRIPITVKAGVLSSTPTTQTGDTYISYAAARAGYLINLSGVTSLTGGGATTLDGQEAGGSAFPVGCIVATSDSNVGRLWRLIGTNIAATDLPNGKVKPTNSDATLNPCYWQLI